MTQARRADRRWWAAIAAVGGLLIAIAVIGVVGIVINRTIHQTVEDAIAFDIELEDRGDDLRVAILEVRHYHRDLVLNDPSATRVELWREQYQALTDEIDRVEDLLRRHPARDALPDVDELREVGEAYHDAFADAVEEIDEVAEFQAEATDLLVPLDAMENVAIAIDRAGEERAAAAFIAIDEASSTGSWVLIAVIAGLGAMGGALGLAVLRLIQEQHRLVAVEQAAVARMAEASRAKTDFIADASHELRTPLTVLRGNAEIGLAMQDDCAHGEILGEIVQESARMSRLVDDLLFLARSEATSVPLEFREIDASELLAEIASRSEVLARERGAQLRASLHADGELRADPGRVEQAILVLVDNAAKYGPPEGTVELEASVRDGRLLVEVRDRGEGIPPEQRSRIFERFYRLDGTGPGRLGGSAGLGLSIAAAIVQGHDGKIDVAARDGGGTIMSVSLPVRQPQGGTASAGR